MFELIEFMSNSTGSVIEFMLIKKMRQGRCIRMIVIAELREKYTEKYCATEL